MEPDELHSRLRTVMAHVFEITPDALPEGADTDTVEKWDSLGHLMLIESVEQAFGVSFDHAETLEMLSEADFLARLTTHLAVAPAVSANA
jgi:acyl carrier protein